MNDVYNNTNIFKKFFLINDIMKTKKIPRFMEI